MRRRARIGGGAHGKPSRAAAHRRPTRRARARADARAKQRVRKNENTTAGAARAWTSIDDPSTTAMRASQVPQIVPISPPPPRTLNMVPKKHIQRESDHLVRIKQGLKDKDKILIIILLSSIMYTYMYS